MTVPPRSMSRISVGQFAHTAIVSAPPQKQMTFPLGSMAKSTVRALHGHGLRNPKITLSTCCECRRRAAGELKLRPKIVDSVWMLEK